MMVREQIHALSLKGLHDLSDLRFLLSLEDPDEIRYLAELASNVKNEHLSNKVHLRGLIEFSNLCSKDCLYCGIRKSNKKPLRFQLRQQEIIDAATFAFNNRYGSIVLQSGERSDREFTGFVCDVVRNIKSVTDGKLGITLSCGEQTRETYRNFFKAGAHRYLLRIETSDRELYSKLHPNNAHHSFETRLRCLEWLKETGYQVGTGVMVGLPFQTIDHLAADLLFIKSLDADMVGLGPYIEHSQTPLFKQREFLWPEQFRLSMTLKMIAILRIMMKDINIASATALQAIDGFGREKALKFGANIIMPSLTPKEHRKEYLLYEDKPCLDEDREECRACLEMRVKMVGDEIEYNSWGDSPHYTYRNL